MCIDNPYAQQQEASLLISRPLGYRAACRMLCSLWQWRTHSHDDLHLSSIMLASSSCDDYQFHANLARMFEVVFGAVLALAFAWYTFWIDQDYRPLVWVD